MNYDFFYRGQSRKIKSSQLWEALVFYSSWSWNVQIAGCLWYSIGVHLGSIVSLLVVAFGFALGLNLGCVGVLSWWVESVGCVIRFQLGLVPTWDVFGFATWGLICQCLHWWRLCCLWLSTWWLCRGVVALVGCVSWFHHGLCMGLGHQWLHCLWLHCRWLHCWWLCVDVTWGLFVLQ